jgi:predicted  nucleic acid-binding Zn-ribbon protein
MSKALPLDFIKEEYSKCNYVFLDQDYGNNDVPHKIECLICGHIWNQTYRDFQKGHRCPECDRRKRRLSLEFVKEAYLKKNMVFLDEKYINSQFRHNIKCLKCGHIWKQSYGNFSQGHGCPKHKKEKSQQTFLRKYGILHNMKDRDMALKNARSSNSVTIKHHWKTGEELVCIAGYEPKVVDYLNSNKINYLWQPEVFQLSTGKTYRPDVYLVDEDKWIEIKGYFRGDAWEKWEEFHSKIKPNSELWGKEKLKSLKLL